VGRPRRQAEHQEPGEERRDEQIVKLKLDLAKANQKITELNGKLDALASVTAKPLPREPGSATQTRHKRARHRVVLLIFRQVGWLRFGIVTWPIQQARRCSCHVAILPRRVVTNSGTRPG